MNSTLVETCATHYNMFLSAGNYVMPPEEVFLAQGPRAQACLSARYQRTHGTRSTFYNHFVAVFGASWCLDPALRFKDEDRCGLEACRMQRLNFG